MGSNLLSGGVDTLNEIKENLLELHGYQSNFDTLILEEDNLEKNLKSFEKDISEEIASVTRKRRQEIEDTFEKQMEKTRGRIRKTKEKRDRHKNMKMSERMDAETASLKEENSQLKLEVEDIFEKNHIPSAFNSKLYFALYSPRDLVDILIIIVTLSVTLFAVPCGIYFLLLPQERIIYFILTYILTVIIFGGIYLFIGNLTKDKHMDEIRQVKILRDKVRINNKKAAIIRRNIRKDRDESTYGLENFDVEITKLEKEIADFSEQKKEALGVFDNSTSQVIAGEIKGRYEEKHNGLRAEYEKVRGEAVKAEDKIKLLTIKIASEYEPFIGKDLMTLDRLEALINIIRAGSAETVSEAVVFYRQGMSSTLQK